MTGLQFTDLAGWRDWSDSRNRLRGGLRAAKARLRPVMPRSATLYLPPGAPRVLVVLDLMTPSCRFAAHTPLAHLDPRTTAVLTALADPDLPVAGTWTPVAYTDAAQLEPSIDEVLSLGSYLGLSGDIKQWASRRDVRFNVVQHGLLTPWSPPAAQGDHLLAWTHADAEYWRSRTPGVTTEVVGSQMLWNATQLPAATVVDERPVVLGQLHGIELRKDDALRAYLRFCRGEGVSYRPHPNEADALSRGAHRVMRAAGIDFETSGRPLVDLGRPVVSIFSTGSLEAAHRGLPAWVMHPSPPGWVRDFWSRYKLRTWGSEPTEAWHRPEREPAAEIARALGH